MLSAEKAAQAATLAAVRASFNKDIAGPVNLAGKQLQANSAAKSSAELTAVIAAFNATVRALNASGQTLLKAIADTDALVPTDPPVPVPPVPVAGLGATNRRTGIAYPGAGGPAAAIAAAAEGDIILVNPGVYTPFVIGLLKTLTIKSSVPGQKYVFDAGGNGTQNRVIELGVGVGLTLEDAEICNNKTRYSNAAGIWPSGGAYDLIVRRCIFHDLSNGIMTGAHDDATVLIEDSLFYDCGDYDYYGHPVYIGRVKLLTFRRNVSTTRKVRGQPGVPNVDITAGHLFKCRAHEAIVTDNYFIMGPGSEANRCADFPNGGKVTFTGNRLLYRTVQNDGNSQLMSFGVEEYPTGVPQGLTQHELVIENNTMINLAGPLANTIWIANTPPTTYIVRNNIFSGPHMPSVKGDQQFAITTT